MKKIILGLILFALIVGVAYLKDYRDSEEYHDVYAQGLRRGSELQGARNDSLDSLGVLVKKTETKLADTLAWQDKVHQSEIDSLKAAVASREDSIASLKQTMAKPKAVAEKKTTPTLSRAEKQKKRELEILSDYKNRYQELPEDLSAYERRVSISEIREETAKKFSISVEKLNQIRADHNIPY